MSFKVFKNNLIDKASSALLNSASIRNQSSIKIHNDYKSTVFSADISGCSYFSGLYSKQNKYGIWQERYIYLNNEFLIYKEAEKVEELKGAIDLTLAKSLSVKANHVTVRMTFIKFSIFAVIN
jgi:hypothetical protein